MDRFSVGAFLVRMNYTEFLEYIYKRYSGNVKLGLDRIEGVLLDMGNPQSSLQGVHIGGTNGKGSACAACEALALQHALHTGLNTSPHLIDYCERFRIDGANLHFEQILDLFHRYEDIFTKWDASFFEITTAIAFQLFKERQVDFTIMEVGLGGRLDATNLFLSQVSVITTIGLDHTKTLGDSVEKIAFEKAGIIKTGVPVVLGRIEPSPRQVILDRAAELNAPVHIIDRDFLVKDIVNTPEGIMFSYEFEDVRLDKLKTNLLGRHQAANLSVALTAFLLYCKQASLTPDPDKIKSAFLNIHWMGRMQLLQTNPTVIVDGAHNLHGMQSLAQNLGELFPGRKLRFVVSILADKDYEHMLQALCPFAETFYISKNESERAAEIDVQADVVRALGSKCITAPTVREVFQLAVNDAGPDDVIIGAGSLYTVAEIIQSVQSE
ncbi:MAG: folylpolyglutamate synthase/dihydrofolate synthase family protein [Candidatus Cloacimonadaceae bacterium]